jgi:uncharacterized protein
VFLLPVQLSVLHVPSPAVTPTNLLFNIVAVPGALLRYRRSGQLAGPLTRLLAAGTLPGVIAGAVIRVLVVPGPRVFRLIIAVFLLPLSVWLGIRTLRPPGQPRRGGPSRRFIAVLALAAGTVGGIYGIGGGSILGPVLATRGVPVTEIAPAALASTFLTSIVGAAAFAVLALTADGSIAPDWPLGLLCGAGGLAGGHLGARLQPRPARESPSAAARRPCHHARGALPQPGAQVSPSPLRFHRRLMAFPSPEAGIPRGHGGRGGLRDEGERYFLTVRVLAGEVDAV